MTKDPAPAPILDLSDLIALDSTTHDVNRNGEPTGWVWMLADAAHPQVVKYRNEMERKVLRKAAEMEAAQRNGRKIKPEETTPEEQKRDLAEGVASRVLDFTPVRLGLEGFPDTITYSPEMAIKLLLHPKMGWLFNDIVSHLTDEKAFMKASASG